MQSTRLPLLLSMIVLTISAIRPCPAEDKPTAFELEPRVEPLPVTRSGPYVLLDDGDLLCAKGANVCISDDNGITWDERPVFGERDLAVSNEQALLKTRDGAIVLVFMNLVDRRWQWDNKANKPAVECRLPVWAARSLDDGQTWRDVQQIQDGYCGAVRDMIETRDGNLVVTVQRLLPEFARHASVPYVSNDGGASWNPTNVIDLGGRGHHDGAVEGTLTELKNGRLWMLLRTNLDRFWEAFSDDGGLHWRRLRPGTIKASSAPGMVQRLASGRLVLLWNRLYPEGQESYERRGGAYSERPGSWHREELSIAFSEDDGATWTQPVVIARKPGQWVSYPYAFERRPGELWITTMQGGLRVKLHEADFVDE